MQGDFEVASFVGPALPQMWYPNAKDSLIEIGSMVALSNYTTHTDNGVHVVREIKAHDVASGFTTTDGSEGAASTIVGVLGIAAHSASVDTNGVATGQMFYSGKSAAAEPTSSVPAQGLSHPPFDMGDSSHYYSPIRVVLATNDVEFWGNLSGVETVDMAQVGDLAWLSVAAGTSMTAHYACTITLSTTGVTAQIQITGIDPYDNTRCKFKVRNDYQQASLTTGLVYNLVIN